MYNCVCFFYILPIPTTTEDTVRSSVFCVTHTVPFVGQFGRGPLRPTNDIGFLYRDRRRPTHMLTSSPPLSPPPQSSNSAHSCDLGLVSPPRPPRPGRPWSGASSLYMHWWTREAGQLSRNCCRGCNRFPSVYVPQKWPVFFGIYFLSFYWISRWPAASEYPGIDRHVSHTYLDRRRILATIFTFPSPKVVRRVHILYYYIYMY